MGLFDMFKGDTPTMTPKLAFASGLIYMMAADGQIEEEEIGQLISVIGGDRNLLDTAIKYVRKNSVDTYFQQAAPLLSEPQKICILVNLRFFVSRRKRSPQEQALFGRFLSAFAVSEETFRPYFEVIAKKNDRSVFNG